MGRSLVNRFSKLEVLFYSGVLSAIKIIWGGYSFGRSDLTSHLIPIFRRLDNSFLLNDFFTNHSVKFGPTYYFSMIMAFFEHYIPLEYLFLIATFFTHFIIAIVTILTCKELFNSSKIVSYFCAFIVLTIDPFSLGGGGWLTTSYFKPAYFVRLFAYTSLYFAIKKKPIVSILFISLGSLIHPTIALETAVFSFLIILTDKVLLIYNKDKLKFSNLLNTSYDLVFSSLILIIFTTYFWISPYSVSIQLSSSKFLEIFLFRTYYDAVPTSFYFKGYIYASVFIILLLISYNWYKENIKDLRIIIFSKIIIGMTFLFCFLGFIFVEIIPSRLVASAMTFRILYIIKWFGIMLIVYSIEMSLKKHSSKEELKIIISNFIFYFKSSFSKKIPNFIFHGIIFFSLLFILLPSILPLTSHPGLALIVSLIYLIWQYYFINNLIKLLIPLLVTTIIFVDILNPLLPLPYKIKKFYPAIGMSYDIFDSGGINIVEYVKKNTEDDQIFIVPPNFGSFRLVAKRAIVVDRKCILFSDEGMLKWWERINDCYGEIPKNLANKNKLNLIYSNYKKISDERLKSIKIKYKANYAILHNETKTDYKILYKDQLYKLIEI
jgi:hypothetical protein